ncbi:MAG: hypothetical protein ACTHK0_13740 [Ginsengibacter sp.]
MIHQMEQLLRQKNSELKKELTEAKQELEIESSLERVRIVALAMNKANDSLLPCAPQKTWKESPR